MAEHFGQADMPVRPDEAGFQRGVRLSAF